MPQLSIVPASTAVLSIDLQTGIVSIGALREQSPA